MTILTRSQTNSTPEKRGNMQGTPSKVLHRRSATALLQDTLQDAEELAEQPKQPSLAKDLPDIILLVVLYFLQGIPLGLAMGSVPFLLKKQVSYAQMATFSLASYPYSLKLLWSPIVDSVYSKSFGRRKSWIVPIQLTLGLFIYWVGDHIDAMFKHETLDVSYITAVFVLLIFLAATQDIAVDGWALELLSVENLSYASTCQTIGLQTGYFVSFTMFLALQSTSFCNAYLRSVPVEGGMVELGGFMMFWSVWFVAVTTWLIFFKKEKSVPTKQSESSMKQVYFDIWRIVRLPNMQEFMIVLLTCKLGFITTDSVTAFKLMEKGFKEEDLGLTALINFPLSLVFGFYAAKWSQGPNRLRPWMLAFYFRLALCAVVLLVVSHVPHDENGNVPFYYFMVVILTFVVSNFTSTVQFVCMGAFFANISDPTIGGTYLTLLNTISNFGGNYPQYFIMKAVDAFTTSHCKHADNASLAMPCHGGDLKKTCETGGGTCIVTVDGYYTVGTFLIFVMIILAWKIIRPRVLRLEKLETVAWRVQ